jgi:hypothetical protein
MGSDPIFWGIVLSALAGGILLGRAWQQYTAKAVRRRWPTRWNLNARPLFSVHERALYKELRAALPNHVVLAKISLLRFCMSADESDAKAWYDRLQALHVSMAVCTPKGVVVSVIDIETHPGKAARKSQKLKEAVLDACRVRYVRCLPGQWPASHLLGGWALGPTGTSGADLANVSPDRLHDAGDQLARKLKQRRAERAQRWAESSFAQDSFFATDSRFDTATTTPSPLMEHDEGGRVIDDGMVDDGTPGHPKIANQRG